ncbi:hypothetical protein JW949_03040 [Candidatus Woesearchaeota archaeon]|nr:hypothetical protein [Candidatus Woesearchaeota archaeon]
MKEFWNEEITKKSFEKLIELNKKYDFILIGGWAIYMWTKAYKSKDIDIVVDYNNLDKLKKDYTIDKNETLKKFEIKQEFFDIDIYVPYFSELGYPLEKLEKNYKTVEGFKVPSIEVLVILKQFAEINRRNSLKGKKDSYDIALLFINGADLKEYSKIIKKINKKYLKKELKKAINSIDNKDYSYFNLSFNKFVKWKKDFLKKL